ncbi:MAG: hypothetical protein AAGF12_20525 [Myxococcota bacterium]
MRSDRALKAATRYLRRNPTEVARILRSLAGLRLGVPIDVFRWLGDQAASSGKADEVEVDPVPPGIRVAATIDVMKTPVRASSVVYVERILLDGEQARIEVRLENVSLQMAGESDSPVAMLIKSGALDLSRPGNLVKHIPDKPPLLLEAADNRIVLDLMKHPKIGGNDTVRNFISLFTSVITVHGVETDERHLDVSLRALPDGVFHAAKEVRRHVIAPSWRRARLLLPGSRI